MSGASAIGGYTYKKDYAAFRILSSEALRLLGVAQDEVQRCIDRSSSGEGSE